MFAALAFFWKYKKDIGYLLAILAILGLFLWYRSHLINIGEDRVKAENARVIAVQQAKDTKVLKDAHDAHTVEIQALRAIQPLDPVFMCDDPGSMPAPKLSASGGAGSGGISKVPAGDSSVRHGENRRDISGLLDSLAGRADILSADARELNFATHPKP